MIHDPVGKYTVRVSERFSTQTLTRCFPILFSTCIFVLPVEAVQVIHNESLQDSQSLCTDTQPVVYNYKHNQFCPNLIFKTKYDDDFMENPIQEITLVKWLSMGSEEKHKHKLNQELTNSDTTVCRFLDKNIKLLAAGMVTHSWNFTASRQCRHVSNKFPENHNVPCELHGESDISLSLKINSDQVTAFFKEQKHLFCIKKPKFLLAIFRKSKGSACMIKVQQYRIDVNMTDKQCEEVEASATCGLYACSEENDLLSLLLLQITDHNWKYYNSMLELANNNSIKPYSDYQFQKPNHYDVMKKKETIEDYFLELLVISIFLVFIIACSFKNCCRLNENQPLQMVADSRRVSSNALNVINTNLTAATTETATGFTKPLPIPGYSYKWKCSKKPACVCREGTTGTRMKWGRDGDESYAPVRQGDSNSYIPSIARV